MTDPVTSSTDRRRVLRVGREVALWAGAIIGVACLVLTVLGALFGVRPVVFRSGSMEPTIGTGALAFTRTVPADDLRVGDVVTVRTPKGVRVTHRINSISPNGEQSTLVLKGDANEVVDADPYVVSSADRVLFSVPNAGYVVNALGSRPVTFAGGILVGLLLVTAFGRRRRDETPVVVEAAPARIPDEPVVAAGDSREIPGRRRPALAVAIGIAAAVLLVAGTKGTSAYFNDSATVSTGSFTAKAVVYPVPAAPRITVCTPANGETPYAVTFTWVSSAPAASTSFQIRYLSGSPGSGSNQTFAAASIPTPPSPPTYAVSTVPINDQAGTFVIVAITPGGTSANSNVISYAGKNNSKTCTGTVSP